MGWTLRLCGVLHRRRICWRARVAVSTPGRDINLESKTMIESINIKVDEAFYFSTDKSTPDMSLDDELLVDDVAPVHDKSSEIFYSSHGSPSLSNVQESSQIL